MPSRDLVPYGYRHESTRDLDPYESGRGSLHPPRESTRDSRAHQTTARGQTSHRDHYSYGSERESPRPRRESTWDYSQSTVQGQTSYHDDYPRGSERASFHPGRESTRDSSQTTVRGPTSHHDDYPHGGERVSFRPRRESTQDFSQTTVRGQTSYHDDYPRAGDRVSMGPGRESTRDSRSHQTITSAYTPPRGHPPHQTSARRDSRANTNYSVPQETAERLWQLDEAYYSNDGETITQRARYSNLTQNTTTEFEVHETPTSRTRIRTITHGARRSPDVHSSDDSSRERSTHRTGGPRHHTNAGSACRDTLSPSRDTLHRLPGDCRAIYDEFRSSTPRRPADGYRSPYDDFRSSTRR